MTLSMQLVVYCVTKGFSRKVATYFLNVLIWYVYYFLFHLMLCTFMFYFNLHILMMCHVINGDTCHTLRYNTSSKCPN